MNNSQGLKGGSLLINPRYEKGEEMTHSIEKVQLTDPKVKGQITNQQGITGDLHLANQL